jgi:hypothetical protein
VKDNARRAGNRFQKGFPLSSQAEHIHEIVDTILLSSRETAELMGLSEGNVKILQHRALKRAAALEFE